MSKRPAPSADDQTVSGRQSFIHANQLPKQSTRERAPHLLALQIAHNLRFQHDWSDIRLHYASSSAVSQRALPRPVISGLPPKRLYVHPDEQIELLQRHRNDGKDGLPELSREREWVLPSHLRETWTLRRFAEVFDCLTIVPPNAEGDQMIWNTKMTTIPAAPALEEGATRLPPSEEMRTRAPSPERVSTRRRTGAAKQSRSETQGQSEAQAAKDKNPVQQSEPISSRLDQPKRILLATLDDDSTAAYYIVHDGMVKPRQN